MRRISLVLAAFVWLFALGIGASSSYAADRSGFDRVKIEGSDSVVDKYSRSTSSNLAEEVNVPDLEWFYDGSTERRYVEMDRGTPETGPDNLMIKDPVTGEESIVEKEEYKLPFVQYGTEGWVQVVGGADNDNFYSNNGPGREGWTSGYYFYMATGEKRDSSRFVWLGLVAERWMQLVDHKNAPNWVNRGQPLAATRPSPIPDPSGPKLVPLIYPSGPS